jgi:hypothetical protein
MHYPAMASYVKSANCIEAEIHLGFDISIRKSLLIKGLPLNAFPSAEARDKAKHCLIVLIGSKKVWAKIGEFSQGFYTSDVYVGGIKFSPVGYTTVDDQLTMDVGLFMHWLIKDGLDHRKVLGCINGQVQAP